MEVNLSEQVCKIYKNTYESLVNRIKKNGYAATSFDPEKSSYTGMFPRDAASQALCHIKHGDFKLAERLLKYILHTIEVTDVCKVPHILPMYESENLNLLIDKSNDEITHFSFLPESQIQTLSLNSCDNWTTLGVFLKTDSTSGNIRIRKLTGTPLQFQDGYELINIQSQGEWVWLDLTDSEMSKLRECKFRFYWDNNNSPIGVGMNKQGKMSYRLIKDAPWWDTVTQPDANYHVIRVALDYVFSSGDNIFLTKYYPLLKKLANYFLGKAFDSQKKLILTMNLEGYIATEKPNNGVKSNKQGFEPLTNTNAASAFERLKKAAQLLCLKEDENYWDNILKQIEWGIENILTVDYNGKKIFAQMIQLSGEFLPGISWTSFSPISSGWSKVNQETLENTYNLYHKEAKVSWDGIPILLNGGGLCPQAKTIGKVLAWELIYSYNSGRKARIEELFRFLEKYGQNETGLLPEEWYYELFKKGDRFIADAGNQEQAAWFCFAMATLFPDFKKGNPSYMVSPAML